VRGTLRRGRRRRGPRGSARSMAPPMPLRFHNTLTRRLEDFAPERPPVVTLYACGPTVYDHVHIGNWSAFLFYDVVVRRLQRRGYRVHFVSNVTDVDDKTIRGSRKA